MAKAAELYREGYNCGESIIKSVNGKKNINIPISVGSGLGAGMCVGGTCGAVAGGVLTIGFIKGRERAEEKNGARQVTRDFMNKVKEVYGTHSCIELKKKGVSCKEIINYVDEYINEEIK